jgi:hypothetical protein
MASGFDQTLHFARDEKDELIGAVDASFGSNEKRWISRYWPSETNLEFTHFEHASLACQFKGFWSFVSGQPGSPTDVLEVAFVAGLICR